MKIKCIFVIKKGVGLETFLIYKYGYVGWLQKNIYIFNKVLVDYYVYTIGNE